MSRGDGSAANRSDAPAASVRVVGAVLTGKLILGVAAVLAAPLFMGALLAGAISAAAPAPAGAGESAGFEQATTQSNDAAMLIEWL